MKKIEISHKSIVFSVLFLIFLWFIYTIRDIVLQFFVSLLLVSILNPLVNKLSKFRIPRGISILLTYIFVLGILSSALATLFPPLIEQTTNLANNLPKYIQNSGVTKYINTDVTKEVISQLGTIPSQMVKIVFSVFSNILNVITVLIFTFYLLLVRDKFELSLVNYFGKEKGHNLSYIISKLESRLGGWSRGQFLLMLLVGLSSYIGFLILNIPFALPLAILAGIFEIIPYLGPILASIPAVILGFSISPFVGVATTFLAILIQQLENYLFVPKVMEKSTGVSPIIILLSLSIGAKIAGVLGMVISIPLVIILQTLVQYRLEQK